MIVEASCTTPTTTSTTTEAVPECARNPGYTQLNLDLVEFENLGDLLADCTKCDSSSATDYCDVVLDICVSNLGSRSVNIEELEAEVCH